MNRKQYKRIRKMTGVHSKRGASAAVNAATKNTNNMVLRRKYCSIDDTNPNTNPKLPSQSLTWPYRRP